MPVQASVETADVGPMMGIDVLEPVRAPNVPYELADPFILVHEAKVPITRERSEIDTTHPHRGFDNFWYILSGSASTGPSGAFERARLMVALKTLDGSGSRSVI